MQRKRHHPQLPEGSAREGPSLLEAQRLGRMSPPVRWHKKLLAVHKVACTNDAAAAAAVTTTRAVRFLQLAKGTGLHLSTCWIWMETCRGGQLSSPTSGAGCVIPSLGGISSGQGLQAPQSWRNRPFIYSCGCAPPIQTERTATCKMHLCQPITQGNGASYRHSAHRLAGVNGCLQTPVKEQKCTRRHQ